MSWTLSGPLSLARHNARGGNGIMFGSTMRAVGHVDLVVRHPIVEVDGKVVLKDRQVLVTGSSGSFFRRWTAAVGRCEIPEPSASLSRA
jgi:hypothetical protein